MEGGGHEEGLEGHLSCSTVTLPGFLAADMARPWKPIDDDGGDE